MAHFDPTRGEIVLRIVYDGLAVAGKTANLCSLFDQFSSRSSAYVTPAETRARRTLYFDWLELSTGFLDEHPLRCQVVTVPGQLALSERRYRLLGDADAVVLVCESTDRGLRLARVAHRFLERALLSAGRQSVGYVVQANKQDLPTSVAPEAARSALGIPDEVPIVAASAITGDGVRSTFLTALDMARDRARAMLRDGGIAAFDEGRRTPEELHEALEAAEGDSPVGYVEAIEVALGEMASAGLG